MDRLSLSSPSFYDPYANRRTESNHVLENELTMSPFYLDDSGPNLVERLTQLCEKAKEAPAYTEYQSQYGIIKLYAISENSGGIIIPFPANAEPEIFVHEGAGATILGWSEHDYCISELEKAYGWVTEQFCWLPIKPGEGVKGEKKAIVII